MQYDRLFNTTRIPGEAGDTLLTQSDSTHIVVLYRVVQLEFRPEIELFHMPFDRHLPHFTKTKIHNTAISG